LPYWGYSLLIHDRSDSQNPAINFGVIAILLADDAKTAAKLFLLLGYGQQGKGTAHSFRFGNAIFPGNLCFG
jgi:hypothetical protein